MWANAGASAGMCTIANQSSVLGPAMSTTTVTVNGNNVKVNDGAVEKMCAAVNALTYMDVGTVANGCRDAVVAGHLIYVSLITYQILLMASLQHAV